MEKGAMKIFLVATATIVASLWTPAASQSSCTTVLLGLSPCLNYIIGMSSTASSGCCSQLGNVVQSQPQCLCTLLNGGGSVIGIALNRTRALALPGACNIQTPPVSLCNAIAGGSSSSPTEPPQAAASTPANPPSSSEAPSSPSLPSSPSAPSSPSDTPPAAVSPTGNGSKSTTKGDSSDGRMNKSVISIVFSALIFGSSLASFF